MRGAMLGIVGGGQGAEAPDRRGQLAALGRRLLERFLDQTPGAGPILLQLRSVGFGREAVQVVCGGRCGRLVVALGIVSTGPVPVRGPGRRCGGSQGDRLGIHGRHQARFRGIDGIDHEHRGGDSGSAILTRPRPVARRVQPAGWTWRRGRGRWASGRGAGQPAAPLTGLYAQRAARTSGGRLVAGEPLLAMSQLEAAAADHIPLTPDAMTTTQIDLGDARPALVAEEDVHDADPCGATEGRVDRGNPKRIQRPAGCRMRCA
jgi:hypothetical protein